MLAPPLARTDCTTILSPGKHRGQGRCDAVAQCEQAGTQHDRGRCEIVAESPAAPTVGGRVAALHWEPWLAGSMTLNGCPADSEPGQNSNAGGCRPVDGRCAAVGRRPGDHGRTAGRSHSLPFALPVSLSPAITMH